MLIRACVCLCVCSCVRVCYNNEVMPSKSHYDQRSDTINTYYPYAVLFP